MVEEFMHGHTVVIYFTIIDGEFYLSSMTDKYTKPGEYCIGTLPQAHLYPSRYLDMFTNKYKSKLIRLMQNIGIKNGVVGIQGFCNGEDIVFTEMGYRLGGTSQQDYTKALYGFSNMEYMINYALCGIMTDEECRENPYYPYECCTLSLISKGGKIGKIIGLDYVEMIPEVIKIENHYKPGDVVAVTNNISQLHFRIFIVAKTIERVKEIITSVYDNLKVFDDNGNYMLDEKMDVERLGKQ